MVAVVGRLFQKWFPAQPNLSYTYIWDKTDAYGQRVYGLSEAVGEFRHQPLSTFRPPTRAAGSSFTLMVVGGGGDFVVIYMHMSGFNTTWQKFFHRLLNKGHNNMLKDEIYCVSVSVRPLLTTAVNSHVITRKTK